MEHLWIFGRFKYQNSRYVFFLNARISRAVGVLFGRYSVELLPVLGSNTGDTTEFSRYGTRKSLGRSEAGSQWGLSRHEASWSALREYDMLEYTIVPLL
jgi:hypothetical protein